MNAIDFSANEDFRTGKGCRPDQQRYQALYRRWGSVMGGKTPLRVGAAAFRPVHGRAALGREGIYPAADYRAVLLLPYPAAYDPGNRGRRKYRLHVAELAFGLDEAGSPGYGQPTLEIDFARNPRQQAPQMDTEVFDPMSVGGQIVAAMSPDEKPCRELASPLAGELRLVATDLWADLVVVTRSGGRATPVTIFRFQPEDVERALLPVADGKPVTERIVAAGETVAVLHERCTYGKARLSGSRNIIRWNHRDALTLTQSDRAASDYLQKICCRMTAGVLDCALGGETPVIRSAKFPPILGHIEGSVEEFPLADGFQITTFAQAKMIEALGYGGSWKLYLRARMPDKQPRCVTEVLPAGDREYFQLRFEDGATLDMPLKAEVFPEVASGQTPVIDGDPIADLVHRHNYLDFDEVIHAANGDLRTLYSSFLQEVAVRGPAWGREGFLVDRRYLSEAMVPLARNWYLDLRNRYYEHIDQETGALVLPAFPREDEDEFVFLVNGISYDATPSPAKYRPAHARAGELAATG